MVDNTGQTMYECVREEEIDVSDTGFGNVSYGLDNNGNAYLYLCGDMNNNYLAEKNDITAVVINNYKWTVEYTEQFTISDF